MPRARVSLVALTVSLAALAAAPAQAAPRSADPGYDPARVETVRGTVEAVVRTAVCGGRAAGVQLRVRTAAGTVPVHVGPAWWSDRQPFQFRRGDRVAITGSPTRLGQRKALVAGKIVRGEDAIALRDDRGRPIWAGWDR